MGSKLVCKNNLMFLKGTTNRVKILDSFENEETKTNNQKSNKNRLKEFYTGIVLLSLFMQ